MVHRRVEEARLALTLAAVGQAGALTVGLGALPAALLALTVTALITGALHLDGLGDFADGIGGGRDRAHALLIMRDSRIGSYGVIALILAIGLGATGLADVQPETAPAVLLLAATGSRLAMLVVLDRLPPAREDGLGRSASGNAPGAWLPGAVAVALIAVWIGPASLPALIAMVLAALAVSRLALRRIGGQTGDVLGATQVTAEVVCILALAAAL
jgi:adenosylcobinamide-GDP ribazoletransferase